MSPPQQQFVCIHCGSHVSELYRKYSSNALKATICDKCHRVADKYIEFESVIILLDVLLLSECVYRHVLYNRDFKLHWKLSLVLLLLESFALWRKQSREDLVREKGFYICCLHNILDYILLTLLLLVVIVIMHGRSAKKCDLRSQTLTLFKAVSLANFSKFFLLPIMVWRENTTEFGYALHQLLVMGHHLCALVFIFVVVYVGCQQQRRKSPPLPQLSQLQAGLIILPVYFLKEYLKDNASSFMEALF